MVTNDYITEGRDRYTTFKTVQENSEKLVDNYLNYAERFIDYVKGLAQNGKSLTMLPISKHCIKNNKE